MKKLKAVGTITEYDPFHNGHLYQLKKAKELTDADVSVIVMSSNWTQRGEPAIFDKWTRTQMALENGADLVVELPIQDAVQPASIFAEQAVKLIDYLKCTFLAFGSEHADWNFNKFRNIELNVKFSDHDNYRKSYPELYQDALYKQTGINLSAPNDTLGFWYAQAAQKDNSDISLVSIDRQESNHNDSKLLKNIASGKAIRLAIKAGLTNYSKYIPDISIDITKIHPFFWDDYWPYLKYAITQLSISDLQNVYQMTDGLEYRFKKMILKAKTFDEFIKLVKSKRYTYTRLQRLCVYILFQITQDNISESPDIIRLLGMNQKGKAYLQQIKKDCEIPIISKIDKNAFDNQLYLECKSGLLTEFINGKKQDIYTHPIIISSGF